jgi:hypothetical protein
MAAWQVQVDYLIPMKLNSQQGWQRKLSALFSAYRRVISYSASRTLRATQFCNPAPICPDRAIKNPVRTPHRGATGLAYERRSA